MYKIKWYDKELAKQLQKSKHIYDKDIYGKITAFEWIEHSISIARNLIAFHTKNKKDFNDKKIKELKYLKKKFDQHLDKTLLSTFFGITVLKKVEANVLQWLTSGNDDAVDIVDLPWKVE